MPSHRGIPDYHRDVDGEVTVGFDGDCLMCSRGIRFLAEQDHHHRLKFLPLQSARGKGMEARAETGNLTTMLVEADGRIYARSAAVLRCLQALGGPWSMLAALGRWVPGRDWLYDLIARNRHRWPKSDVCALPSPPLRARLLSGEEV